MSLIQMKNMTEEKETNKEKYQIISNSGNIQEREGIIREYPQCIGERFAFEEYSDKNVKVTHVRSGTFICRGETIKKAETILLNILKNKEHVKQLKEAQDISEYSKEVKEKTNKVQALREEFKKITNIMIPIDPLVRGIDIVRLDKQIYVPDGISLEDYIIQKWGKRASDIVNELIELI